jgi:hypothetical protein
VYGILLRFVRGMFTIHSYRTTPKPVLAAPPGPPLAHQRIGFQRDMNITSSFEELISIRKADGWMELLVVCVAFKLDKTDEQEQLRDWYRFWHDE